jgi:hypothetical protein
MAKRCDNFVKIQMKRSKVDTDNSSIQDGMLDVREKALNERKTHKPSYQIEKSRFFELFVGML